jgi:hypothetical protein
LGIMREITSRTVNKYQLAYMSTFTFIFQTKYLHYVCEVQQAVVVAAFCKKNFN